MNAFRYLIVALITLGLTACSTTQTVSDEPSDGTYPNASSANTAFGLELYRHLEDGDADFVYSPISVTTSLAMAYGGARGDTANEIGEVLRLDDDTQIHNQFAPLSTGLETEGETTLRIANSVWVQNGLSYGIDYLTLLDRRYGSEMRQVDFQYESEESRSLINEWVEERTEGVITDYLPFEFITDDTRLVLANALYLGAAWEFPFQEERTQAAPFETADGDEVEVQMMRQQQEFRHISDDDHDAVELPYADSSFSMVVIMPKSRSTDALLRGMTPGYLSSVVDELDRGSVQLGLPRFEIESEIPLKEPLMEMGMDLPFDREQADFRLITRSESLFIENILHVATISVDEDGTEATASTAVGFGTDDAPSEVAEIIFDRPFVFFVRDRESGTVLFMGQVVNPS